MCDTASRDWDRGTRAIVTIRTSPQDSRTTQCSDFIPVHVPMQIKLMMEHATRVAAWTAMEDRLLLVQRWQGTKISKLSLPNKTYCGSFLNKLPLPKRRTPVRIGGTISIGRCWTQPCSTCPNTRAAISWSNCPT